MALLNPYRVWDALGYRPHRGQVPVVKSDARFRVVSAGRRFGKSDIGGHDLINEALIASTWASKLKEEQKRREFWIVGPEYSDSEKEFRILWNGLSALEVPFDKPGSYNNPEGGMMHIKLWDGTFQVHAKSAKHPETLVGEGLHGVVLAEAAKLKQSVWFKYIRPTLADFNGWALMTSTPEGKNWFYEQWQRGQDSRQAEWDSWRMPSWMNPFVYKTPTKGSHVRALMEIRRNAGGSLTAEQIAKEHNFLIDAEVISLLNDLTDEAFNQEIAADFTEFVGRVFKDFDEELHVTELEYVPHWQHYAAMDYGFTNPSVWLFIQVTPWGDVQVLDEIYERGMTADEFAGLIQVRDLDNVICFYPDPASPGDNTIIERIIRRPQAGGTGGELNDRISAIRRALRVPTDLSHLEWGHPERKPMLQIDRKCKHLIYEMNEYRYPERRETILGNEMNEKPMKKDDHAPEALGRFFAGHGFATEGHSRVSDANIG
jgi:hypothetical protein